MSSVPGLRAFADSASLPVVVQLDIQQKIPAKPQSLAICGIDSPWGNRRMARRRSEFISDVRAEVVETAARIAATTPPGPNNGKSADG